MWFRPKNIVPLFPSITATMSAMREKDPDLALAVGYLPLMAGIDAWREKYPEDFLDGGEGTPGPHNIHPKPTLNE